MLTTDCAAWALSRAERTGMESTRAVAGTARVVTRARLRRKADARMASLLNRGPPERRTLRYVRGFPTPSVTISWQTNRPASLSTMFALRVRDRPWDDSIGCRAPGCLAGLSAVEALEHSQMAASERLERRRHRTARRSWDCWSSEAAHRRRRSLPCRPD